MTAGVRSACWLVAAAMMSAALPSAAQQASPSAQRLVLPMPAAPDWGAAKPPDFDPREVDEPGNEPPIDCGRDLPCRVRLRGVVGRNGGVAVEGTAFTW